MLSKFYTTEIDKEEPTHDQQSENQETEEKKDLNIWEIESSRDRPTTSRVIERHVSKSKKVLEFNQMLDQMINGSSNKSESSSKKAAPSPLPSSSDGAIAQSILEMMKTKGSSYKKQKPLPQSAVQSMYSGISQSTPFSRQNLGDPADDPLLDYLSPESEHSYNWDQTIVSKDERIAVKQEEMEATQAIVEAPTTLDLWHHISNEINREAYPNYYPNVLTKAIEHASKTDPYLALTIFEKAKQKSIMSYISGCTVQVYNAMLLLRWEVWRDINGMLDLAEEMTVNGIEFDNQSRRIIRAVVHEIESEDGGYVDPQDDANDGVFWNADEKRSCNLIKELAGKWMISE
ncbi:hypothetical protein PS15m_007663 [Mucor circinelloides]